MLSEEDRWRIVDLHRHGNWSPPKIASTLRVDPKTVRHWIKVWQETGEVHLAPIPGRPKISTESEDKTLVRITKRNREGSSRELVGAWCRQTGVQASARTVRRRLKAAGAKNVLPPKAPLLTDKHKQNRVSWAKQHQRRRWDRILWSDEKTFYVYGRAVRVWQWDGEKFKHEVPKHSPKVNVWACFSRQGWGEIHFYKKSLDSDLYIDILDEHLLSCANAMFTGPWFFQDDGATSHTSRKTKKWKADNNVPQLSWPANSPDLNPMEDVWGLLVKRISRRHPSTTAELQEIILDEWKKLDLNYAVALVDSMRKWCRLVIEGKGETINY